MSWTIELVVKGQRPTLLEADKANQVIKALQALSNISIQRGVSDSVLYSDDEIAIYYNGRILDGYYQKEIEVCEGGEVKTYMMLVRAV